MFIIGTTSASVCSIFHSYVILLTLTLTSPPPPTPPAPHTYLDPAATRFADLLGSVRRGSGPTQEVEARPGTPPPAAFSASSPPHTPVVPMQSK